MKTAVMAIVLGGGMLLGGSMPVDARNVSNAPCGTEMTVELIDGSRLVGRPCFNTVQVQTTYAALDVELSHIQRIDMADGVGAASVTMHGGDLLKGEIALDAVPLETRFGKIDVGVEHVVSVLVVSGDALSAVMLHYELDSGRSGTDP